MERELTIKLKEYLDAQEKRLMEKLTQIENYQRLQNGRVATSETAIAVLIERVNAAEKHGSRGLLAGIVSGLGLVAAAVYQVLSK